MIMATQDPNEQRQLDMAQAVRNLRDSLPAQMELEVLLARVTRHKYIALLTEGFTEQQALDLCKK
jgi:hypothetical protein